MLGNKKMVNSLPFFLLVTLIFYEIYKRVLPVFREFKIEIITPVMFILILTFVLIATIKFLNSKGAIRDYSPDTVLYTRDKVLIQYEGKQILIKVLKLIPLENAELEVKFSEIAELLAHMGINSSLAIICSPKKQPKYRMAFHKSSTKEELEVSQSRVIFLWVEEERGVSKATKAMLDRAENTIRAKLGESWEIESIKTPNLREFLNNFLFRFQLALAYTGLQKTTSSDLIDSLHVELGKKFNGSTVRLSLRDLSHHIAILGRTGSGKTTTSKFLISKIWEIGVPVLIFDYENEYRDLILLLGGRILSPSSHPYMAPASINVLQDIQDETGLDEIIEIFEIIFGLTQPQVYLLLKGLLRLREQAREQGAPTLIDLYGEIASLAVVSETEQESKRALLRRIYPLIQGEARRVLCKENLPSMEELMSSLISIELKGIATQGVREIFVFTLLRRIYSYNKQRGRTNGIRHVTVIEEAEKVLPRLTDQSGLTIGDRILSELRKYGEGFIVISQSPSNLSPHIIRNASTKIIHALGSSQDISIINSLLGSSRKAVGQIAHQIHRLKTGECFVMLRDSSELPRIRIRPEYLPPELGEEDIAYLLSLAPRFYRKWRSEVLRSMSP